ncbi:MAG: pantetheine-phosphate adenylyltransferase [Desulfovibrionaceae bacterium]|nr:pantetheine-phosphate adenylyltransferase [Desulfovibrionaceae bacterium]
MGKEERIAIYPGTFDPLTNGHASIVRRGLQLFDKVILAVASDTPKTTLFSLDERVSMAKEAFKNEPEICIEPFRGLLVDYARERGACALLRGLRAVSDFEYEFQSALMNRRLNADLETVFLMSDYRWLYISSTVIRTVAELGGEVEGLVPEPVVRRLREKYPKFAEKGINA